jgi:hypothetical protein
MDMIIIENTDGSAELTVSFYDEGVLVEGTVNVLGGEAAARRYAPHFAADLRAANAELFPVPAPVEPELEELP